jgi:multicomponent Na+:H+ antiporter subunit F
VIDILLVVLGAVMVIAIGRVIAGPTNADRMVALDLGFVVFISATALLTVRLDAPPIVILVLAATLVGFLATVALAHLLEWRSR